VRGDWRRPELITVGDLRERLRGYPDGTEIDFGSTENAVPLEFYRVKDRGPNLIQIELNEVHEREP
jgi:hypothetical protein